MPPATWSIESEMMPTDTPAPVGPSARACGPVDRSVALRGEASAPEPGNGVTIAFVTPSAAALAIASGGR